MERGHLSAPTRDPALQFGPKLGLGRQTLAGTGLSGLERSGGGGGEMEKHQWQELCVCTQTGPPTHPTLDYKVLPPAVQSAKKRSPALGEEQQIPGPFALFSARKTLNVKWVQPPSL